MKIAIVDDDKLLALKIWKKLKKSWFDIVISNSINDFKKNILDNADLFIIDICLWNWQWFEIIKWLRDYKNNNSPIIIISGYTDIENKLKCFNMWIDDYICKPVILEELLARVIALLRRGTNVKKPKIEYKDLVFDFEMKEIYRWVNKILLTRKELQIVEYFLLNIWNVVTKNDLMKSVWWYVDLFDISHNTINATICKMRRKLWDKFTLETIQSVWYILRL